MYTVMYGWRLALVALEPADAVVPLTVTLWLWLVDEASEVVPE